MCASNVSPILSIDQWNGKSEVETLSNWWTVAVGRVTWDDLARDRNGTYPDSHCSSTVRFEGQILLGLLLCVRIYIYRLDAANH